MLGGVRSRRPYLSNLAGEAVRDMNEEPADAVEPPDPVLLWLRRPGRPGSCSGGLLDSTADGVELSVLLALTIAVAACDSCCEEISETRSPRTTIAARPRLKRRTWEEEIDDVPPH